VNRLLLWSLLLGSSMLPANASADDVLLDTFGAWAQHVRDDLSLADSPTPHRVSLSALDYDTFEARGVFGAVVQETGGRGRPAKVEVVSGDDQLDSSRFAVGRRGQTFQRLNLVVEDVPRAIERDLWMATDGAYKTSLQGIQSKRAAMTALGGEPPPGDWSAADPVRSLDRTPRPEIDRESLTALARDGSARLRDLGGLHVGEVRVRSIQGHYVLGTSEGTAIVQPEGHVIVHARAAVRRGDGLELDDERQWIARTSADLPPAAEIIASIEALGRSVLARQNAEAVPYYEGPVLFEGAASADFFRYLVPPQVQGTPPPKRADRTWTQQTRSGPRIGRKLLPDGWSVVDEPGSARAGEGSGYVLDREGVPGRRVELVQDGYVRDLLMTRVPRDTPTASTGHARGLVQSDWDARMSTWTVTAARNLPASRFDKELKRAWSAGGQDRVLVVRRLARGKDGSLPRPTDAVWRYGDGREEPALAVQFQETGRRTLRDIAAAGGGTLRHAYLAGWKTKDKAGRERGIPTTVEAPARLLVLNLEAVFPGPQKKPHSYGAPPR
jgi:hypothetical protein